jgi:Zn-dependent metalloprotease
LVVYALGVAPRLAYESIVDGVGRAGMSRLSVYVDALTGSVITTREHVVDGSGTGAYNGPNPLDIPTLVTIEPPNFPTYYLKDPRTGNLQCGGVVNGPLFVDSDDVWGDGHAQEEETACVDAMFAAQTEVKMLSAWLGRNAMDGSGSAWPILVGTNEVNAVYTGTQVRIGHNTAGLSLASLDVVGHEMGHGVDDNTPVGSRGLSGGSTQEFIADVFGALTEWYANEPAAFDPPDFQIGEKADRSAPARSATCTNPALVGDPACYSDTIPTSEVHAGAGPGDHWFYLLAMGSNPNGQPTSPTCDNKTVTGVGIQTAAQILYNAMLMKTSDSSYLTYRTGTLTAAKDLTPGDCTAFRATRAAWNAVSVPEQTGDPTCHDLFVFNPGQRVGNPQRGRVHGDGCQWRHPAVRVVGHGTAHRSLDRPRDGCRFGNADDGWCLHARRDGHGLL